MAKVGRKRYFKAMAKRLAGLAIIGVRLRMVRTVLGHSQADWARALRITRQMLNRWEQGTRQPNLDVLSIICQSTGCTTDFILRGQVGLDMRQELREALLNTFSSSPYVYQLFSPESSGPTAPSSAKRNRRAQKKS